MTRDWEGTVRAWAQGPGKMEKERAENAERMVRDAIRRCPALRDRTVDVFAQGSYRNRTNVRQDSDVDICVRYTDEMFVSKPFHPDLTDAEMGTVDSTSPYRYAQFKDDVETALRAHFGSPAVTRGDKAIAVHENSYRVDADVVATFEHRRYQRNPDGTVGYFSGTELRPDSGGSIQNWPEQNYENGVAKNERTGRRFKAMVRALKRLHNEMLEYGGSAMPSYLLECLVFNVPDEVFGSASYVDELRNVLAWLIERTATDAACHEWGEVNELKYLFRSGQPWTREQAHTFLQQAWHYLRLQGAF